MLCKIGGINKWNKMCKRVCRDDSVFLGGKGSITQRHQFQNNNNKTELKNKTQHSKWKRYQNHRANKQSKQKQTSQIICNVS